MALTTSAARPTPGRWSLRTARRAPAPRVHTNRGSVTNVNVAERWIEGVVGHVIDWDATGTWVGGLGTMLAVAVAGGIALFQHWSNHDVAKAAVELRMRRLGEAQETS